MKGIVTGGAGFIGSHIVDKLLSLGWEVIVIDNLSAQANEEFFWNEGAKNYTLDICDYDKINPLFKGVDVVFHLAAESRIQPSIKNPVLAAKTNVVGTCNILQSAREHGVKKVIYSSTSSAYGSINIPPLQEEMPKDCLNPYSVTKCAGEDLCRMYTNLFEVNTIVFRYFNVYGDRQPLRGQYAPVVGIFLRQNQNNEPMTIVGDGLQRRDFTHVSDVVEANILAATSQNKLAQGQIINIGTGRNHSVLELSRMIGEEAIHIASRPGEAAETLADNTRAREWLCWEPKVCLEDWVREQKNIDGQRG